MYTADRVGCGSQAARDHVLARSDACWSRVRVRPISLLALSLLRLFDSNLPGNPLWT